MQNNQDTTRKTHLGIQDRIFLLLFKKSFENGKKI